MKKPSYLKFRRSAARMNNLNEYLSILPRAKTSDKICDTELNELLLNSMTNSWSRQAYVQGFDCETITFTTATNMFENMEIAESIYEVVV